VVGGIKKKKKKQTITTNLQEKKAKEAQDTIHTTTPTSYEHPLPYKSIKTFVLSRSKKQIKQLTTSNRLLGRGKNQETKYKENEVGLTKTPQITDHMPHQTKEKKNSC